MDKILFTSFLILFLAPATLATSGTSVSTVDPAVVAPGESFTVNVRITNDGSETQYFQELRLEEKPGFKVIEGLDLGGEELCRGCRAEDSMKIKVLEDKVSGRYQLTVSPVDSDQGIGFSEDFRVTVDGSPNLFVTLQNSSLKGNEPGYGQLKLENIGTETSYQTEIYLQSKNLEITPARLNIGDLKPGESLNREVKIESGSNPEVGLQTLSMTIDYKEGAESITKEKQLSVNLKKDTELSVSSSKLNNPVEGKETRILLELENTGIGEIESIRGNLECTNSSMIKSDSFVGSLEEGENVPTVYRIVPNSETGDCNLDVRYGDEQKSLETEFSFEAEQKNYRNVLLALPVAALVVIGLLLKRRNRGD